MGLTDKALEILLGVVLLAALIFLAEQEIVLRHDLSTANKQLTIEQQCRVGSACAKALADDAARGATLVAQARAAADTATANQKAALDQQAADAIRGLAAQANQAQKEALSWKQKYQDALKLPDCAAWAKQAVACSVQ